MGFGDEDLKGLGAEEFGVKVQGLLGLGLTRFKASCKLPKDWNPYPHTPKRYAEGNPSSNHP